MAKRNVTQMGVDRLYDEVYTCEMLRLFTATGPYAGAAEAASFLFDHTRYNELNRNTVACTEDPFMGLTALEIGVANPAEPKLVEPVKFLIDSGAVYSVVPADILQHLKINPLTEEEFYLAGGSKITCKKGVAVLKYGDRIGGADVIFGQDGDSTLLGAFTFEALGLSLDSLRRELKPPPMILAISQRDQ